MTKRVVSVTKIDPLFNIPSGAEDEFVYMETPLETEDFSEEVVNEDADEGLQPPDTFTIVSQVIRRGKGNHQLVDIVFETELIEAAEKYEIKVTKL